MKPRAALSGIFLALSLNGCAALGLGVAAGYVAHDEATEDDDEFDPLEKVLDED